MTDPERLKDKAAAARLGYSNINGSCDAFADGRASMRKEIAEKLRALDCYSMPYSIVALIEELQAP